MTSLARLCAALLLFASTLAPAVDYPKVEPSVVLSFPRDHGSHPLFRTEWWYVTGWVEGGGETFGIQITFFRSRPGIGEASKSNFAPRELLFAHAALADSRLGRLRHDQRAARAGLGLAQAAKSTTDVRINDWTLKLVTEDATENYMATVVARDFRFDLRFNPTQPVLLQGEQGFSRKGPNTEQASYYYSRPHLGVSGSIEVAGRRMTVSGQAWLDHEWSSEALAAEAQGWDWIGVNFDDGSALMAFQMRQASGEPLWAAATWRRRNGRVERFEPEQIRFVPLRRWRSARSQAEYPVAMRVEIGGTAIVLNPLMDDQELDSRASVGTIYWEGAVRAVANEDGRRLNGHGYLELTGYWKRLKL